MAAGLPPAAAQLRALRMQAQLTQEELAERAGVSVRTVRNLEGGRVMSPRTASLRAIATALGLTAEAAASFAAAARGIHEDPNTALRGSPRAGAEASTVPAMLPGDVPSFVGRHEQLEHLDRLLDETDDAPTPPVLITAVSGTAGVGKTALAVHWAHRRREHFPEGQLYLNLRGFDPSGSPLEPEDGLRQLLDALGIPPHRIPSGLAAQTGLFRSLIDGRRLLVLLDNARDADQVRPLIPGSSTSRVVITSRNPLLGLVATHDARPLRVDLLTAAEARDLLVRRLGKDRVEHDPAATEDIIQLSARLPLALTIIAARARIHPGPALRELALRIRASDETFNLLTGDDNATDLRAVFGWSYRALSADGAAMFRLLGLHRGPDLTLAAAASLAGIPAASARQAVDELSTAGLVSKHAPDRFQLHDVLRAYAAELAATVEPHRRRAAIQRMLDHYLHSAVSADRQLEPHRDPVDLGAPLAGAIVESFQDRPAALAWLGPDHPVLVRVVGQAAATGFHVHAWQLAWALAEYFVLHGLRDDFRATQRIAVVSAQQLGDREAEGRALRLLANASLQSGSVDEASEHLERALEVFEAGGDRAAQANVHINLCIVREQQGLLEQSNNHAAMALSLYRQGNHRVGEANALNFLGYGHALTGDLESALISCQEALTLSREIGHHKGAAHTADSLGYIHERMGNHDQAASYYDQALELFSALNDRYNQADVLLKLGDVRAQAADEIAAAEAWRRAGAILEELEHPRAEEARDRLHDLNQSKTS